MPLRPDRLKSSAERRAALRDTGLLDAPLPTPEFDRLARLAARLLRAPAAFAALVDDDRCVILGAFGPGRPRDADTPFSHLLCQCIVASAAPLVIADVRADAGLRDQAGLAGLGAVAYLGAPLVSAAGHVLGTLCVTEVAPRAWSDDDVAALVDLATQAVREIELRLEVAERRRLIATLEGERVRITEFFALAPAFICVLGGPDHVYELANPRYYQLIGHRDVIGRRVRDAVPELEAQGFVALADRVLASGEAHVGHGVRVVFERAPGAGPEERVVNFVFQPRLESDGTRSGVFVLGVDVTEQVRAHEQLERHDVLLQDTQRIASIGSWESDLTSGAVTWTDEMFRLHGLPLDAAPLAGADYFDLIHPDDRDDVAARVERAATSGQPFAHDYRIVRPDGAMRSLHGRGRVESDESGRRVRMLGSCQDITERVRALAALRESEERYRLVQQATHDVIWDLDITTGRLALSETIYGAFRYTGAEAADRLEWWEERIHPEDHERVTRKLRLALERGDEGWREEYRFRRGDGTYAQVIDRAYVLRDESGRAIRMIGAAQDVTEQTSLEAQLRQAQRMEAIGQLAGGVAHDFNNLLTVIAASTMFARAEVPRNGAVARELDRIEEANRRAADLTRQLLAFSRKQVLRPQSVNVNQRVAALERMLRRVIGEDVHIETRLAPGAWPVYVDPAQLEQVLLNLVVNARDAMPAGGTVRITTANVQVDAAVARAHADLAPGPYLSLVVEDTGVGISPELLPHVFEPFVTTKEAGKGTGLGLPMVYGFVKQSGGHVKVESTVDEGTTFTVLLPRDDDAAPARVASSEAPPVRGSETVLVVEDDAAVRGVLARVLTRGGYRVLEAADGEEALRVWRAHTPGPLISPGEKQERIDVVLTDLVMPVLGGRTLVERLRTERTDARIIVMTGYTADTAGAQAVLADGEHFALLQKPIRPDDLLRAVQDIIGGSVAAGAERAAYPSS
jgi:PAS domain S-box-containing protein